MAVTLCNGCGVGDAKPKHNICFDWVCEDIRAYHPSCCPQGPRCEFCPKEAA